VCLFRGTDTDERHTGVIDRVGEKVRAKKGILAGPAGFEPTLATRKRQISLNHTYLGKNGRI
jgi:hypothetical protein